MTDILSKSLFIAGMVASAARSTASYYIRGPRCAKWSLLFQIRRDVMYKAMSRNLKSSPTDAEIEQIDFGLIARHNTQWDLPASEVPADMGAFRAASIFVADIDVDPDVFAGAGPAESGLRLLVARDLEETGREIPYELTAPISMLGDDLERVFKCTPIDENENIILYLHGGGYKYGSPASHRGVTGRLSGLSGLRCISIHYRLAPLHPYPAQLYDGFLAFVYLMKQGFKPQNILIDEMSHPLVSPVNGNFKDFPPTLIQAGDKEVLADDIAQFYENLLRDNPDRHDRFIYECYTDMIHVFHQFLEQDDTAVAFASAGKFMKGL
ncbi:hypothetical protein GGH13_000955 [Coemansia sp. S155-1]|nr:hypothetical protein GGH13_000955 [Coemansia sp. S155-1]